MSINLTNAQQVITATFHTNAASVYNPVNVNVGGDTSQVFTLALTTVCNVSYPSLRTNQAVVNEQSLGGPDVAFLKFPYGTIIRRDDRVVVLGKTFRVVSAPVPPQFALETKVGAVDASDTPIVDAAVLLDNSNSLLIDVSVLLDDSGYPLET